MVTSGEMVPQPSWASPPPSWFSTQGGVVRRQDKGGREGGVKPGLIGRQNPVGGYQLAGSWRLIFDNYTDLELSDGPPPTSVHHEPCGGEGGGGRQGGEGRRRSLYIG